MSINDSFNRLKQQIFSANVIHIGENKEVLIGENREVLVAKLEEYKKGLNESGNTLHAMQGFMYRIAIVGELVKNGKVDIVSVKQKLVKEHGSIYNDVFDDACAEVEKLCDEIRKYKNV